MNDETLAALEAYATRLSGLVLQRDKLTSSLEAQAAESAKDKALIAEFEARVKTFRDGSFTIALFDALGESNCKVARWLQGADPFEYWSREQIEQAVKDVLMSTLQMTETKDD